MKDLYVGYEQILPLVKQSNSKVTSSEDLKFECSVPTAAILPEAATPVGDAETTEAPPTAEKPEDPNELQPESTPAHAESHVRHGMFMASPNRGVMSILEKCDQITCAHQTKCVANLQSGDVSCNCTGTHYTGRFCQFCERKLL